MKSRRHTAIKKAKKEYRKNHLPALRLIKLDKLEVKDMNLKNNINTQLKRASLLTVWSESEKFQVQIELALYDDQKQWKVEYCQPIGDTSIDTTVPQKKLNEQLRRNEEFNEYQKFVQENRARIIRYLLEEYSETKDKLSI